ncbi:hypothetical protein A2999_01325 [Candidatus Wolfebacteria bacterium RIFCSPLOWO2_01_FULL_38_11]|uniref:Uncharacterized protein n=1 Tax=Candidatus Wolfebacteria bacterium RIFCSPLOWO2_01_FULL_38_11 TaxID=1802556 RepID=A0A1F8DVJ7_9BACT|nr:MAG: hypothetical protein A2999_01325 [Candidatus Wolfebacteria bacterium RIFCSPLOWO2_01_FULL_38_11]
MKWRQSQDQLASVIKGKEPGKGGQKKPARKIPKIGYAILFIILVSVISIFYKSEIREWIESRPAKTVLAAQIVYPACYDAQDIMARGASEIIARPNCWSGNISIPPQSWFRIVPSGKVTIRTWAGRVIRDGPGQANWLGDDIRDGNFRIISDESQPVKVAILSRPK